MNLQTLKSVLRKIPGMSFLAYLRYFYFISPVTALKRKLKVNKYTKAPEFDEIKKLKNTKLGEACVIVGNGPSGKIRGWFCDWFWRIFSGSNGEKSPTPATHWCCPPFYYYTKSDAKLVRKGIDSGCGTDAPGSYIAWLCKQSTVHAMEKPGNRYDIGNLESYEKVKTEYNGITL